MKAQKVFIAVLAAIMVCGLVACSDDTERYDRSEPAPASLPVSLSQPTQPQTVRQIYLYGEHHGRSAIIEKEWELWQAHYNNEDVRHLFLEESYYAAEFLNVWMQSDNDDILDTLYDDWESTPGQVPAIKEFYRNIKRECPETIFHGTDIGHQYNSTGERFIEYLEQNGLADSKQYTLALEAIEQGERYYEQFDDAYRENKMVENFIREFDALGGESVMGIYGGSHTSLDAMNFSGSVPSMATQLNEHYGDVVHSQDLSLIVGPDRIDTIIVNGQEYEAFYYGTQNMSWAEGFDYREFWRLEDAYGDFKDCPKTGGWLPYDNYPIWLETGQVFVVDSTKTDGSVTREYFRSDGNESDGKPITEQFTIE